MLIGMIVLCLVGIALLVIGCLLWQKEKITLLHDYHYDKVTEENKKIFCTLSGIGICIIGVGLLLTALLLGITDSAWSFLSLAAGMAVGLVLLISAGLRYNR